MHTANMVRVVVAAACVFAALVATAIAFAVNSPVESVEAAPTQVVASPQPTATIAPTPTPAPAPVASPVVTPQPVIPASAPRHLSVPARGINGDITAYTQADIDAHGGSVEPASLSEISWDSTIPGGMPGTDSTNTTYLYGHSWIEPAVFNSIKDMQVGDIAVLTSENGELHYVMTHKLVVDKTEFAHNTEIAKVVPGRLVLVSCYRPAGYPDEDATVKNVVAILQLDR